MYFDRHANGAHRATAAASAVLALVIASGCGDETTAAAPPFQPLFSLAVLADPHIASDPEHDQRLSAAVEWINDNAAARQIELVVVLGDVGWGAGLPRSRELLDELDLPYVPLIGDNEVHVGDDETFHNTYQSQYEQLASVLDDWRKAPTPVYHPQAEEDAWLQNVAFSHRGVHFFGLDWCVRGAEDEFAGEFGDLNDFSGGTWPWFEQELEQTEPALPESIVMLTHIPMMIGLFFADEMAALAELLGPRAEHVYANLAGHVHGELEWPVEEAGYTVYTTDATWDDEITVRVIRVDSNGTALAYQHENVVVD